MVRQTIESPKKAIERSGSTGLFQGTLIFIFRLLLLGISSISAGLMGVAIASVAPGEVDDPPPLEMVFRQVAEFRQR